MTQQFALASGLAELYERFCTVNVFYDGKLEYIKMLELFGDEMPDYDANLSLDIPIINDVKVQHLCNGDRELAEKLLSYFLYRPYGEIYKNVVTGEQLMIDRRITFAQDGTNGMAAGNDFKEAFSQGFSEVMERWAMQQFCYQYDKTPYVIPNDKITNPELKKKIDYLTEHNQDVYILDLGYNFGVPTVYVLVYDKSAHRTRVSFGAFPVFDIALERCLTEMYQNVRQVNKINVNSLQVPFKHEEPRFMLIDKCFNSTVDYHYVREDLIDNIVYVDGPCKDVYADENTDTYQYWIDKIIKNNWHVYVLDTSLSSKMTAIKIFVQDFMTGSYDLHEERGDKLNWRIVLDIADNCSKMIDSLIGEKYDFTTFYSHYKRIWSFYDK